MYIARTALLGVSKALPAPRARHRHSQRQQRHRRCPAALHGSGDGIDPQQPPSSEEVQDQLVGMLRFEIGKKQVRRDGLEQDGAAPAPVRSMMTGCAKLPGCALQDRTSGSPPLCLNFCRWRALWKRAERR